MTLTDRLAASQQAHEHYATLHHRDAARARDFLTAAIDHGWSAAWKALHATSGAPYVTVQVIRDGVEIRATWHTHKTGTWRWDGGLMRGRTGGWKDLTSQQSAFAALQAEGPAREHPATPTSCSN